MSAPHQTLWELRRGNFYAFYLWVFGVLHPGKPFRPEPYVMAMAFAMEQFATRRNRRQLIAVPPRHGKSLMASVALCAFIMGRDPTQKILVASYGAELAGKHGRDFRTIVSHPDFRRMFPGFMLKRMVGDEMETTLGGIRKAVTPNGSTTGFGANFVIIDDLTKVTDARSETVREAANAYVDESLYSRFDDKADACIMAIQQRTHERDVVGHLRDKGGSWSELFLPAIAQDEQSIPTYGGQAYQRHRGDLLSPTSENAATLAEIVSMLGAQAFSGQYLQNPVAPGGNRIHWDWFDLYTGRPKREQLLYVVQSWDTALSERPGSDYSVCITFGYCNDQWLVLDVMRRRMSFTDQCAQAKLLYRRWQPDKVLIEQASTGGALADWLRQQLGAKRSRVSAWPPRLSKEERVEVYNERLANGFMSLSEDAAWVPDFRSELTAFPAGRHDDQVDALFQFLEWLFSNKGRAMMNIDPITGHRRAGTRPHGQDYSQIGQ